MQVKKHKRIPFRMSFYSGKTYGYQAKEEAIEEGRKEGIEKGIKEGIKEGKMQIAKEMLKDGYILEKIADITKLPIDDIKKLKF